MPKDHYVAQTYLKNFCASDGMLQRYFKGSKVPKATKRVPPKSVCYVLNGDTNTTLDDPRLVQKFLTLYENAWGDAILQATPDKYSKEIKEKLAGYIYYMQMMTPFGRKRLLEALNNDLQARATVKHGGLSKMNPEDLSPEQVAFLEAVEEVGVSAIKVKEEFSHGIAIKSLFTSAPHSGYTVSSWQFLMNTTGVPFITSDHPVCFMDFFPQSKISRTFTPLTTNLGVIITPDFDLVEGARKQFKENKKFYCSIDNDSFKQIKVMQVKQLNQLVIKSATELVLSNQSTNYLDQAIGRFKNWQLRPVNIQIPAENGLFMINSHELVRKDANTNN